MTIDTRSYGDTRAYGDIRGEPIGSGPGGIADRRLQIERAEQERVAERQHQIALQSSPLSTPDERIRLWEKLHALRLPSSATHKLLHVIAQQTSLSVQQVLEEQQRRAEYAAQPVSTFST